MALLNVNPTRMELTKLKNRLKTAARGHKLLKDKQDELMRQFIEMIRKNKALREETEKMLEGSFRDFLLARSLMSDEMMEAAVAFPKESIQVDIKKKNVMSVYVPVMEVRRSYEGSAASIYPYGFAQTSAELDNAISKLYDIMPKLLELAEIEKACQLMAYEIEKTRRRVNALEYMTIPQLEETIKFIRMKLDENERGSIIRLMKVKSMMATKEEEEMKKRAVRQGGLA